MRELSLHILDLLENAIRAGATIVSVSVAEDPERDAFDVAIEDNGPGLPVSSDAATDPFYTTQRGKRTGLGLSLFKAAAEQAGGALMIEPSKLGGVAVKARMQLRHVDRQPLGDLAGTFSGMVLTHPDVDFWCRVVTPSGDTLVRTSDLAKEIAPKSGRQLALARRMNEAVRAALARLTESVSDLDDMMDALD